jgi:hypothetical protein
MACRHPDRPALRAHAWIMQRLDKLFAMPVNASTLSPEQNQGTKWT